MGVFHVDARQDKITAAPQWHCWQLWVSDLLELLRVVGTLPHSTPLAPLQLQRTNGLRK